MVQWLAQSVIGGLVSDSGSWPNLISKSLFCNLKEIDEEKRFSSFMRSIFFIALILLLAPATIHEERNAGLLIDYML